MVTKRHWRKENVGASSERPRGEAFDRWRYLNRQEAAEALRVSVSTVDRMVKRGDLERTVIGRRVVFALEAQSEMAAYLGKLPVNLRKLLRFMMRFVAATGCRCQLFARGPWLANRCCR
jgi:excisionase family DNA binding protein